MIVSGGGGGTFNQHTIADEYVGPASYPTGGFVIDLSKTFSSLNSLDLVVKKGSRGANLPAVRYEIVLDSPGAGQATVKIVRKRYDRTSTIGNVSGQPAGVTIQAASGVVTSSESAHTHGMDHDHASFSSAVPSQTGAAVLLDALGNAGLLNHTHALDLPAFVGTSGAGTSHNHVDNTIYAHVHVIVEANTNYASSELPNATNLTGTTFYLAANGIKL